VGGIDSDCYARCFEFVVLHHEGDQGIDVAGGVHLVNVHLCFGGSSVDPCAKGERVVDGREARGSSGDRQELKLGKLM